MAGKKTSVVRRTVADLLKAREKSLPEFTAEQAEQVELALKLNDSASSNQNRLSARAVTELLRAEYGFTFGDGVMERMACKRFARRSWSSK